MSWDAALGEIASRLRAVATEFGPEAIQPYSYAGTMGLLNGSGMDRRFFHRLGASRLDRTICSTAGNAGMLGALGFRYGTEPEQFTQSKLIIAWGANVLGTNVHLWPFILEARRKGAKFITIDPRKNRIVWQYGHAGVPGRGSGFLNTPDGLDFVPLGAGNVPLWSAVHHP